MKETDNLKLKKPDYTDDADIEVINENMDKIDEEVSEIKEKYIWFGTVTEYPDA